MYSRRFSDRSAALLYSAHASKSVHLSVAVVQAAAISRRALQSAAFITFSIIFRALFAIPFAKASAQGRSVSASCPGVCDSCQETWFLVYEWLHENSYIRALVLIVR
jgi:hypothetical protein